MSLGTRSAAMPSVLSVLVALVVLFVDAGCSKSPFVPLKAGECLPAGAGVEGQRAQSPETIDCGQPHRYEVFAVVRLEPPNDSWPGERTVSLNAEDRCAAAIEEATGLQPKDTPDDVELLHIDPTQSSWKDGDRDVECLFRWDAPTSTTLVRGAR